MDEKIKQEVEDGVRCPDCLEVRAIQFYDTEPTVSRLLQNHNKGLVSFYFAKIHSDWSNLH
ncbi:MAG TPA: hypothetical protein PK079_23485 [Leptospiraceae bacterium]|nr:hypothetical protein [Leptospiraceae bacterium]HMW07618.1 hypothetical protein [Leptospiraceae bacterium]HMX33004.1 hypothetical protein [Leptospiraceae bacterium]HMY33263.1 hypothetical protein [Leptospiraceae bacterium]HMZ66593.1 hypothetical protein [Leptospiraceae bacterium]